MVTQTGDRLTDIHMTVTDMVIVRVDGNPGAIRVLREWIDSSGPIGVLELVILDSKRLYGSRIWELYKLCGQDIERFKYHVQVELPNQQTGQLSATGPYGPGFGNTEFWEKRKFGKPESFWALENPPDDPNYEYPIR